jgi:hypothetical protein
MEEWDRAINDFVLRCNSCLRANQNEHTKIIHTSREKYYCEVFKHYPGLANHTHHHVKN